MGVSTDAILFYGYIWGEPGELYGESDDEQEAEWEKRVARSRGLKDPWDALPAEWNDYGHREEFDKWKLENKAAIDEWYKALHQIETEFGCAVGWHGSDEWSAAYVYVNDSELTALRGYPQVVEELTVGADWDRQLAVFVKAIGAVIPDGQTPAWRLASWWG